MERSETSGGVAVGALAPNFRLASAQGPAIALEEYRGQRNVVLWFSKGLYCPFCRRYMAQLHLGYKEIQQRGAEVLQATYSTPEEAQLYFQQYQLLFPYLCDPEWAVFRLYGLSTIRKGVGAMAATMAVSIATEMSDRLFRGERSASPAPYMKRYGSTDMEQAAFIIDKSGVIRYVCTTSSFGGLPSNAEYLRQLERLQ